MTKLYGCYNAGDMFGPFTKTDLAAFLNEVGIDENDLEVYELIPVSFEIKKSIEFV